MVVDYVQEVPIAPAPTPWGFPPRSTWDPEDDLVAVGADLGEQPSPLETAHRVVHRAVGERDDAVVVPLAHQPDHLVGVHIVFAQQRQNHDPQRREPIDRGLHGIPLRWQFE